MKSVLIGILLIFRCIVGKCFGSCWVLKEFDVVVVKWIMKFCKVVGVFEFR